MDPGDKKQVEENFFCPAQTDREDARDGLKLQSLLKGLKKLQPTCIKGNPEDFETGFVESTKPKVDTDRIHASQTALDNHLADEYNFTHQRRGRAIIISNEMFDNHEKNRLGSKHDVIYLQEVFQILGFDVICCTDLTAREMINILRKEANSYPHEEADCLAVAILSHGGNIPVGQKSPGIEMVADVVYGVNDVTIHTSAILELFNDDNCPGLKGKPRLFFIQACRGGEDDIGVDILVHTPLNGVDHDVEKNCGKASHQSYVNTITIVDAHIVSTAEDRPEDTSCIVCPASIYNDYLVMYATPPGKCAWRRETGSWFVESLHAILTRPENLGLSLTQALTRVIKLVAQGYASLDPAQELSGRKQTPVIESRLIKDIYFTPKYVTP